MLGSSDSSGWIDLQTWLLLGCSVHVFSVTLFSDMLLQYSTGFVRENGLTNARAGGENASTTYSKTILLHGLTEQFPEETYANMWQVSWTVWVCKQISQVLADCCVYQAKNPIVLVQFGIILCLSKRWFDSGIHLHGFNQEPFQLTSCHQNQQPACFVSF